MRSFNKNKYVLNYFKIEYNNINFKIIKQYDF